MTPSTSSLDPNQEFVDIAPLAGEKLLDAYFLAGPEDRWQLRPAIKKANQELLEARLNLLTNLTTVSESDILQLVDLRAQIEQASAAQGLVQVALRLAQILAAIA